MEEGSKKRRERGEESKKRGEKRARKEGRREMGRRSKYLSLRAKRSNPLY
jgi:hypothetical protein